MYGKSKGIEKWIRDPLAVAATVAVAALVGTSIAACVFISRMNNSIRETLDSASDAAVQYDYEAAVSLLSSAQETYHSGQLASAISGYNSEMAELVPADVEQIPHIFFHSLIVDTALAFDGDSKAVGYNQFMTTREEFREILEQLYRNGYVLVSPYDAYIETEDGFVPGEILLPRNKRPVIISQDDVNYYSYMEGDGFAQRLVLEDGRVRCAYTERDGSVRIGDYDLIPILDDFVDEHPDFSYRGAKAVIAVTGYEGAFGYHSVTDPDCDTYEEEAQTVREIAEALRASGYDLASHTYGHIRCGTVSTEVLTQDTADWAEQIGSLIGDTDILIYPYGEDLTSDVQTDAYEETESFGVLYDAGFRYFMNVDSSHEAWTQLCGRYFRGARRNIDGFRMYYYSQKMYDLFYDMDAIYDTDRPRVEPLT